MVSQLAGNEPGHPLGTAEERGKCLDHAALSLTLSFTVRTCNLHACVGKRAK
jgi:hypothetical protein